uniref:Uncharacterized protein n=1 Tax=Globisporangium ultimum (strain ATCC 200006 / CBS 805.95 / DAOM BR144) TaxID=431595 RepID=K3WFX0_GLOUD
MDNGQTFSNGIAAFVDMESLSKKRHLQSSSRDLSMHSNK